MMHGDEVLAVKRVGGQHLIRGIEIHRVGHAVHFIVAVFKKWNVKSWLAAEETEDYAILFLAGQRYLPRPRRDSG